MAWLKRIALALLFALLFGMAIGTVLRLRLERTQVYIGSVAPRLPLDVGQARAPVLDPGDHEQQVG
jgi:hypothetical protein